MEEDVKITLNLIKRKAESDISIIQKILEHNSNAIDIKLFNYSKYVYLKQSDKLNLKKQLIFDNVMEALAKNRGDFFEYSRYKCLQLELLLDTLFYDKYQDRYQDKSLYHRFKHFINDPNLNFTQLQKDDWGKYIYPLIEVRNIASHRDKNGLLSERIERKVNSFHLKLTHLKVFDSEIDTQQNIQKFIKSRNWEEVKVDFLRNNFNNNYYAFIDLYQVNLELNLEDIIKELHINFEKPIFIERYRYGNRINIQNNRDYNQNYDRYFALKNLYKTKNFNEIGRLSDELFDEILYLFM
jgi:hypothetical protein